jgi:hypothetical protein
MRGHHQENRDALDPFDELNPLRTVSVHFWDWRSRGKDVWSCVRL